MSLIAAVYTHHPNRPNALIQEMFPHNCAPLGGKLIVEQEGEFSWGLQHPNPSNKVPAVVISRDREKGRVLLSSGRLFNHQEVAEELVRERGCRMGKDPWATLLMAYDRWREGCLSKFRGQFAFVLWDRQEKSILAARDRFGILPLYYTLRDEGICFASLAKQILWLDGSSPIPHEGMVMHYLVGDILHNQLFSTQETFFRNIYRVMPGHYLRYYHGRVRQLPYWDVADVLMKHKHRLGPEEYFALLKTVIQEQAGDFDGVGSAVSGGLDSPAIFVLLRELRKEAPPLPTISLGMGGKDVDETENIRRILGEVTSQHTWIYPDQLNMFDIFRESTWHQECPTFSPSPAVFYLLKKCAQKAGIDILFTGLGGDEVLGGLNLGYLADLFHRGRWFRLYQELRSYTSLDCLRFGSSIQKVFRQHVLDPISWVRAHPPVPRWIRPEQVQNCQFFPEKDGPGSHRFRSIFDARTYDVLARSFTPAFLQYEIHNAAACGLENRFPFLDHRLVEYALRLPWEERMSGGIYKVHHRKAFEGLLPDQVIRQETKTLIPSVHDRWLRETYAEEVRDLLCHANSSWDRYLHRDAVLEENRRYVESTDERTRTNLRRSTWRAISLELWFRAFWP